MTVLKKWLPLVLLAALCAYALQNRLVFEQDLLRALDRNYPDKSEVFRNFQGDNFASNKIFLDIGRPGPDFWTKLASLGYQPSQLFDVKARGLQQVLSLTPYLAQVSSTALAPDHLAARLEKIVNLAFTPGTGEYLQTLATDPLGLTELILASQADLQTTEQSQVLVFERRGPLDFDKVAALQRYLETHIATGAWTGGDFFALENYRAVKFDIMICSTLSLIAGLLIFYYLCPNLILLAILFVGTAVSYLVGLAVLSLVFATVFTIVLTFTSTFVSFNNEYLIHFSGIRDWSWRSMAGLGSAIGTTFIGFAVLLFSGNPIVSQLGLVSIGGMVGFLGFLYLCRSHLQAVSFRKLPLPSWLLPRRYLLGLWLVGLPLLLAASHLEFATDISEFRYTTAHLEQSTKRFQQKLGKIRLDKLYGAPLGQQDIMTLFAAAKPNIAGFHPLQFYETLDSRAIASLNGELNSAAARLLRQLTEKGVTLRVAAAPYQLDTLSAEDYLELWQMFSIKWLVPGPGDQHYLALPVQGQPRADWVALAPQKFYSWLLTDLEHELLLFFLIGLALMALYLVPWQRSFFNILYIFTPLLLAVLGVTAYAYLTGRAINLIHAVGFSLVIAVALDYSSILISSNFSQNELTKVIVTGLIALSSFVALMFARHPVMHDLGVITSIGISCSLVFCVFFHYHEAKP